MIKLIKIEGSIGLLNREIKGEKEMKGDRRRQKVTERKRPRERW